jgi:hypothetical protein
MSLLGAGLMVGFVMGWLLRMIFTMAAISVSQERMQRKIHYWQSEAMLARAKAAHLGRMLEALTDGDPDRDIWRTPDDG